MKHLSRILLACLALTAPLRAADLTLSANMDSLLGSANYAAARTNLGLVIGTNVQAFDADLSLWAAITPGTGVGTLLATPSSANLAAAVTDETGTGLLPLATSPTFTTSLLTDSTTFALFNTTATTVNAFGSATTLNIGASAATVLNLGGSTTAAQLRFLEPSASGTNYTAFRAVAQSANITYSLPATVGAAGTYLKDAAGDGVLSWAAPAGSGDALTSGTLAQFASTTSLQLAGVISNETGSGALVFGTAPTFTGFTATGTVDLSAATLVMGPIADLGTPGAGVLTNCTGLPLTTGVTGTLPVANGGTGRATGTTAYALIATGTTATGAQQTLSAGATTEILVGGGASALPVWTTASGTGAPARVGGPGFTGDATATTATAGDNDTSIATTAFVNTATRASRLGSHTTPDTTAGSITWTAIMYEVFANTATTYALPAAAGYDGRSVLFYNTGSNVITIDPNGSEVIVRDGTVQTGGVTMTLTAGAGNYVGLISDGVRWVTLGYKGTLAAGS